MSATDEGLLTTELVGSESVTWETVGYEKEYAALRGSAGVLELGGSLLSIEGDDAVEVLHAALTRDIQFLAPERALTALVLTPEGGMVDVVTVFAQPEGYLLQTGPGRGDAVTEAITEAAEGTGTTIKDLTAAMTMFAVEGPLAWRVVLDVLGEDYVSMAYESTMPATLDGAEGLVARSGYTGEYGYTFLVPKEVAPQVRDALTAHCTPVGYRALETAMLEVRQPVLHRDADADDTVVSAGLNWLVDLTKDEFVGRAAVVEQWRSGGGDRPIGFRSQSGAVSEGELLFVGDEPVGSVRTVVESPGSQGQLGLARVAPEWQAAGLEFCTAAGAVLTTLAPPYVVPTSWSTPIGG